MPWTLLGRKGGDPGAEERGWGLCTGYDTEGRPQNMSGGAGSGGALCQLNKKEKWFHGKIWIFEVGLHLSSIPIYPPSVQFSLSVMSDSLRPRGLHHARPPSLVL